MFLSNSSSWRLAGNAVRSVLSMRVKAVYSVMLFMLAIAGCSRYGHLYSKTDEILAGYDKPVRWTEGTQAVREDIQAVADLVPLDNRVEIYLKKNGAICGPKDAFPAHMTFPGAIESLGSKKIFCARGQIGFNLYFEERQGEVVLEKSEFFPSYFDLSEARRNEMQQLGMKAVPPASLFVGSNEDVKAKILKLLEIFEYDYAFVEYLTTNFELDCQETQGTPDFEYPEGFLCKYVDFRFLIRTDLFGRYAKRLSITRDSKRLINSY